MMFSCAGLKHWVFSACLSITSFLLFLLLVCMHLRLYQVLLSLSPACLPSFLSFPFLSFPLLRYSNLAGIRPDVRRALALALALLKELLIAY